VTTSVALLQLPPMPGVPDVLAGRLTVAVRIAHVGDPEQGAALVAPMRAAAQPLLDGVGVMPYTAVDMIHSDPVDPMPAAEQYSLLRGLDDGAVDALVASAGGGSGSTLVVTELRHLGGALAREGDVPSALCWRDSAFTLLTVGIAAPPTLEAALASSGRVHGALAPWRTGATLPNFGGGSSAYDGPTLARLRGLVARLDPAGVLLAADELGTKEMS